MSQYNQFKLVEKNFALSLQKRTGNQVEYFSFGLLLLPKKNCFFLT